MLHLQYNMLQQEDLSWKASHMHKQNFPSWQHTLSNLCKSKCEALNAAGDATKLGYTACTGYT